MMDYSTTPGVQGICPAGWHVPADEEWNILTAFLGGESIAGGKMKTTGTIEAGTGLWYDPNTGATNLSGFSALPGGMMIHDGSSTSMGNYANFWSSTEYYPDYAKYRLLYNSHAIVDNYGGFEGYGLSVRCVKGTPPPVWSCGDPITDERDNQTYTTVQIDTQCWMAENLNIGTMISGANDMADNIIVEKYCYDDNTANCDVYGGLYQWNEMMDYSTTPGVQGICPAGWHLPADAEWTILTTFLGGESIAGGKMKTTGTFEAGTGLWYAPNTGATNSSGFTALPGGDRDYGGFYNLGKFAFFWSSTETYTDYAWDRVLHFDITFVSRSDYNKTDGFSVRCVKGNTPSNLPPSQPAGPNPSDNSQNQSIFTQPSWTCTDPENDPLTYDVYFGTSNPPSLVSSGQTGTSYNPGILENSTLYSWKIVAHDNHSNTTEGPVWSFTTLSEPFACGNPLLDTRDNQTYNTVQIGTQCWMAENLNIGTMIPGANQMANNSIIEKYCYNNNTANCDVYGGLYQWNEMMQYVITPGVQGICPADWHLPADAEWLHDLTIFLGGEMYCRG